jgi:hypothetical protein
MCCVNTSASSVNTLPVAHFVKCQILKISRNSTGGFRSSGVLGGVCWQLVPTFRGNICSVFNDQAVTFFFDYLTRKWYRYFPPSPQKKFCNWPPIFARQHSKDWRPNPHSGGNLKFPQIRPCHGFGDQQSVCQRGGSYSIRGQCMWGL